MTQDNHIFDLAAAGFLETVAACHPDLDLPRPGWWPDESAWRDALNWAIGVATGRDTLPDPLPPHTQRVSIFTHVFPDDDRPPSPERYIPFHSLRLDDSVIFPQPPAGDDAATQYDTVTEDLRDGLDALKDVPDRSAYLLGLVDLLQRTTWCLPAPHHQGEEPDVSLFDLSRVVAALMPCYDAATEEAAATLVYGDLSGVQDFIYTITARGATSGLRGRSVYLQLLTEAMATTVLRELDLPPTSLIYAGGGHFLLVAPAGGADTIQKTRREISQKLLRHHQGDLYLALGAHTLAEKEFRPEHFGAAFETLMQTANRTKQQRFSDLDAPTLYDDVFRPQGIGGDKDNECRVCHYEAPDPAHLVLEEKEDVEGDPIRKCRLCKSLEEDLGDEMRRARYLLLAPADPTPLEADERATWQAALRAFGMAATPLTHTNEDAVAAAPAGARIWALDDDAHQQAPRIAHNHIPVLLHYMVNVTPRVSAKDAEASQAARDAFRQRHPDAPRERWPEAWAKGDVRPFELIEDDACGIKRLGVLRMDVDDLGDVFARGFGQKQGSLARTAALSFATTLFFEGWVDVLAEAADRDDEGDRRHVVYSIYSGGDDLFIVGAWDVLPELAHTIARDLQQYAAGNPVIHASAGITLHGGKFPLYQMADAAKEALAGAKAYRSNGHRKDAFTFLGRTRPWRDYDAIHEEFARLRDLTTQGVPRSLIQYLVRLDGLYQEHIRRRPAGEERKSVYWGPWHWRSAYQLTRVADQNQPAEDSILAIRDSLSGQNFNYIHLLGLSARWAELFTRQSSNQEEGGSDEQNIR